MFMSINCGKGVCEMQHISKMIAVIVFGAILVRMALWPSGWEMFAATMSGCALIAFVWGVFVGGNPVGSLFQVAAGLAVIGWAVTYGAVIWLPAIIGAAVLGWSRRVPARFGRMAAGALGGAIVGGVVTITAGPLVTSALATITAYWWVGAIVIGGVLALVAWSVSRNPDKAAARVGLKRLAIGTAAVAAIGGLLVYDAGSWGVGESGTSGSAQSNTLLTVPKPTTQAVPRPASPAVIDLDAPAVVDLDGGGGEVIDLDAQGDSSAVVDLDGTSVRPARRSDRVPPPQRGEIGASAGFNIGSPDLNLGDGLGWLKTVALCLLLMPFAYVVFGWLIGKLPGVGPVIARNLAYPLERLGNYGWRGKVALWAADQIAPARIMQTVIRSDSGAHGSDRLQTDEETKNEWGKGEVDAVGRPQDGLVLGKAKDGTVLRFDQLGSVLVEARPNAGKTVKIVIPTLLTPCRESRVILDPKAELYRKTAGFRRALGQRVLVVDPEYPRLTSGPDARINILTAALPAEGEGIAKAAIGFCAILIPRPEPGQQNKFFTDNARELLLSFLVFVRCAPDDLLGSTPRSLYGVKTLLQSKEGVVELIKKIVDNVSLLPVDAQPLVLTLGKFAEMDPRTFSSAPGEATSALDFLDLPGWRRALCYDPAEGGGVEYTLADFFEPGTDLYLTILSDTLKAMPGGPRLLIGCLMSALMAEGARREESEGLPSKVRFVLDEVAQLGKCEPLVQAVVLGRTVARVMFVVQYFGQLEEAYGKHTAATLINSFALKVYLTANDESAAKRMSAETGEMTILDRSTSANGGWSYRESGRSVLKPGDILHMDPNKLLVITPNRYAAMIDAIVSWRDPRFAPLIGMPLDGGVKQAAAE
jgi:type IV secretory pathway TraG/TraD family ATPase VirD4